MSDLDMGLIIKALAAAGGIKALQANSKARSINKYAQRSGVNYDVGNFYGSDPERAYAQIDAMVKAHQNQGVSDYMSQYYGVPAGPLEGVKNAVENVAGPVMQEQGKYQVKGNFGRKMANALPYLMQYGDAMNGADASLPPDVPQTYGVPAGSTPGGTPMLEVETPRVLSASARQLQMPELPQGDEYYYDPEMIRDLPGQATQRYNARSTRMNAETNRMAEDRQQELQPWQLKLKELETQKVVQQIQKLKQELQYNPRLYEARIASLARSNRGGGSISKLDYLIKAGKSVDEIANWIMNGEDTSRTTVTYDKDGNPIQTRVTNGGGGRGGSPAAAAPGKPVVIQGRHGSYSF